MKHYSDREHALVIGSGIGGMVCARVLSEHFSKVTIIEKDSLPKFPTTRKSVPQGQFLHILLAKGLQVLDRLFPNLLSSLQADGAVKFNVGSDIAAKMSNGWIPKYKSDIWLYGCSRPLLEWHIHNQLIVNSNINIIEQSSVTSLLYDQDKKCVTGVRLQQKDTARDVFADIVVDTSGRTGKTIKWLEELGFKAPEETVIRPPVIYSCRKFKKPANFQADWKLLAVYPDDVKSSCGGFVNPIENDQWMVTLWGVGEALSRDDSLFLEFARSLPSSEIYDAIKDAEPLSSVYSRRKTISRINHFEKLDHLPDRFFVLGDAVCTYNPVYGQGMTSAILGALELGDLFLSHPQDSTNLAEKFYKKLAEVNYQIWQRGTMDDQRWDETTNENEALKNEIEIRSKYMERIWGLAIHDTEVAELLWNVMHFLKPVNELMTLDIQNRLASFEKGKSNANVWHARVDLKTVSTSKFKSYSDLEKSIRDSDPRSRLDAIAEYWAQGGTVNWQSLHQEATPQRLHLPTYPFEKQKFCVTKSKIKELSPELQFTNYIHPLLQENTSDLFDQQFTSCFTGTEFFIRDHRVNGEKVLPGSALLEMARVAVEKAFGSHLDGREINLKNVNWVKSIELGDSPREIRIRLSAHDSSQVQYEVYSKLENAGEDIIYSQGEACLEVKNDVLAIDIDSIRSQLQRDVLKGDDCYQIFKAMGCEYREGYQCIQEVFQGEGQILARLSMPSSVQNTKDEYVLHPSLMECALQSSIYLIFPSKFKGCGSDELALLESGQPFALERLDIINACTPVMYSWVRYSVENVQNSNVRKVDIDLCDDKGNICAKFKGARFNYDLQNSDESLDNKSKQSSSAIELTSGPIVLTPREKVEFFLKQEISNLLNQSIDEVETTLGFFEMGLDSLGFLMLVEKIQNIIQEKFPPEKLFEYVTIEQISNYLDEKYPEQIQRWNPSELQTQKNQVVKKPVDSSGSDKNVSASKGISKQNKQLDSDSDSRRLRKTTISAQATLSGEPVSSEPTQFSELIQLNKATQGRPIFWVHGGIGGVQPYYYIAEGLRRPFYGIQAKGKITTSSLGMKDVASYYIRIMKSVQPKGPYELGGYSLGGLISYEITRQLQEQGEMVSSIVMLDTLDTSGLEKIKNSVRSQQLLFVNLTLASRVMQDPSAFSKILIHQNELDNSLEPRLFKEQLVELASKKGLVSKANLKEKVGQMAGEKEDYDVDQYALIPLPHPEAVKCYYFRNKSGLFYGELEPYFNISTDKSRVDNTNYWSQWQKNITNFHIMDVDTPNHMNFLLEPKAYEAITEFCHSLYSKQGMTEKFLDSFTKKLKDTHGVLNFKEVESINSTFISRLLSNITGRGKKVEVDPA